MGSVVSIHFGTGITYPSYFCQEREVICGIVGNAWPDTDSITIPINVLACFRSCILQTFVFHMPKACYTIGKDPDFAVLVKIITDIWGDSKRNILVTGIAEITIVSEPIFR